MLINSISNACHVDIELDINTKTEYQDCWHYADSIVELVRAFIIADNSIRSSLAEHIAFVKKRLRECEKANKHRKAVPGGKIHVDYDFKK